MDLVVELRYSVLISLLTLLWLAIEYMAGFQDMYISWYPFITIAALMIPIVCYQRAFREKKTNLRGNFTFRKAVACGLLITFFSTILALPTQLIFHRLINPEFIGNMFDYTVKNSGKAPETVATYVNLHAWLLESVIFSALTGIIITFILSWRMQSIE